MPTVVWLTHWRPRSVPVQNGTWNHETRQHDPDHKDIIHNVFKGQIRPEDLGVDARSEPKEFFEKIRILLILDFCDQTILQSSSANFHQSYAFVCSYDSPGLVGRLLFKFVFLNVKFYLQSCFQNQSRKRDTSTFYSPTWIFPTRDMIYRFLLVVPRKHSTLFFDTTR